MMPTRSHGLAWAGLLLLTAAAPAAEHPAASPADIVLPPKVGKPLQAAQGLIRQHKFAAALTQINKAAAAGPLTPEETSLVEQMRGIAAQGAGDTATAAAAFEKAIATGKLPAEEQLRLIEAEASLAYQVKDYPETITWSQRYVAAGGKDEAVPALLVEAYYQSDDWADTVRTLNAQIAAGVVPNEAQLRLLADAELKQNDATGYQAALERLVAGYPRPEYWTALIQRLRAQPDFPGRLSLDLFRLSQAVGVPTTAAQYTDIAEIALEDELPGEAKTALDQGFTAGVLGNGPQAARQGRLRVMATDQAAADLKTLAQQPPAQDGPGLVKAGLDYLGQGQAQKAVLLIQQGIAKGGLPHPDEAKLHLALAYYDAGQKDQALQTFHAVQTGDEAQLARLWILHFNAKSS
jgi:tetratricopeptide (TPR) repeat protein